MMWLWMARRIYHDLLIVLKFDRVVCGCFVKWGSRLRWSSLARVLRVHRRWGRVFAIAPPAMWIKWRRITSTHPFPFSGTLRKSGTCIAGAPTYSSSLTSAGRLQAIMPLCMLLQLIAVVLLFSLYMWFQFESWSHLRHMCNHTHGTWAAWCMLVQLRKPPHKSRQWNVSRNRTCTD